MIFILLGFIFISYSGVIRLLPRYYFGLYLTIIVLVSVYSNFKSVLIQRIILMLVVAINMLCLAVENIAPIFHHKYYMYKINELNVCINTENDLGRRGRVLTVFEEYKGEYLDDSCNSEYHYVIEGNALLFSSKYTQDDYEVEEKVIPPKLLIASFSDLLHVTEYFKGTKFEKILYRTKPAKIIKIKEI